MQIERLGSVDPLQNAQKQPKAGRPDKSGSADSVSVSSEAQEMGELYRTTEAVKALPDDKTERIAELKAKIDDPSYINDAVVSIVADRIIDQFGL